MCIFSDACRVACSLSIALTGKKKNHGFQLFVVQTYGLGAMEKLLRDPQNTEEYGLLLCL